MTTIPDDQLARITGGDSVGLPVPPQRDYAVDCTNNPTWICNGAGSMPAVVPGGPHNKTPLQL